MALQRRVLTLCRAGEGLGCRHATAISILQDDILLEIFDLCQTHHDARDNTLHTVRKWHRLAHVCQRWRQIVFASPHRLNLQILCAPGTPVRQNLDIWPALPLVIDYGYGNSGAYRHARRFTPDDKDSVIAVLEHADRVCYVRLHVDVSQLDHMAAVMQKPFPMLTDLHILSMDRNASVLSAEFLGGSAPRLQTISLQGIPFLALPMLLLSASHLVSLHLLDVPPTGYISPEAMVASLAALPRLENFRMTFRLAASRPDRICAPPVTRTVLPALTFFTINRASEYLEDLAARIDGPHLDEIVIDYTNQLVGFQVAQLSKFIHRSVGLKSIVFTARVTFFSDWVSFDIFPQNSQSLDQVCTRTNVACKGSDWQLSHMAQVLSHSSATLSNAVHLKLKLKLEKGDQLDGALADDAEWLHLLRRLSTVQTLHVPRKLAKHVALALEDITGEMVTETVPSLDLICLEGQPASSIQNFVAARQLFGVPVTIIDIGAEFGERLESYARK